MNAETKEKAISEHSRITLSLCIVVLGLSFSVGIAWAKIAELEKRTDVLTSIDRRLSRIEGKLGVPFE